MKYLSLLLSVYLLSLSFFYCNDDKEHLTEAKLITTITETHDSNHQDSFDYCTPFCICACCSMTTNLENLAIVDLIPIAVISEELFLYNTTLKSDLHFSIWQPPKVS